MTYNATSENVKFYQNGHYFSHFTEKPSYDSVTDASYLYIGTHPSYNSRLTASNPGHLACLQFYNEALSLRQIRKLIIDCKNVSDPLAGWIINTEAHC